jgi:hypothetical protein
VLYDLCEDGEEFAGWRREFLRRFPTPARRAVDISAAEAEAAGFAPPRTEAYSLNISFDLDRYVRFALTQSSVTSAVEEGRATVDEIRDLMNAGLAPVFGDDELTLAFSGYVTFLRRTGRHRPESPRKTKAKRKGRAWAGPSPRSGASIRRSPL